MLWRAGNFVLLAGAGNLALAAGKGMGKPCFRIIQTHFSQNRANVGDIAAKEEVKVVCLAALFLRSILSLVMLLADLRGMHAS